MKIFMLISMKTHRATEFFDKMPSEEQLKKVFPENGNPTITVQGENSFEAKIFDHLYLGCYHDVIAV